MSLQIENKKKHINALYNTKVIEWNGSRGKLKICKILENYGDRNIAYPNIPIFIHIKMDKRFNKITINDYVEIKIKEIEGEHKYPKYTISQIVTVSYLNRNYKQKETKKKKKKDTDVIEELESKKNNSNHFSILYDSDSDSD